MTIKARFDGKVFVPEGPVDVRTDEEVTLELARGGCPAQIRTELELVALFKEMDEDALATGQPVDYSRESIYTGTVDDPR
jgi:hypothetical protein